MTKGSNILRIVKEDILRLLSERRRKVSLNVIKEEIRVFFSFVPEAIEELEKEGLTQSQQGFFELTEKGEKKANGILDKHLVCENYFKKFTCPSGPPTRRCKPARSGDLAGTEKLFCFSRICS